MAEQPLRGATKPTRVTKRSVFVSLPSPPQDTSDPRAMEELMGSLDQNNDGELTFSEFWQLIGNLASKRGGFS